VSRVIDVRVPDMGNFKDVTIIDVLVKPGDTIERETPLLTLETEKATMDVPSTVGGVIERVAVSKGGHVNAGDIVVAVRSEDAEQGGAPGGAPPASEPASDRAASTPAAQPTPLPAAVPASPPAVPASPPAVPATPPAVPTGATATAEREGDGFSHAHASPSVRKLARELGVRLESVSGTGFKGRITQEDVKGFVKKTLSEGGAGRSTAGAGGVPGTGAAGSRGGALPSIAAVDFAQFGPIETKPLSRIQRISGARLHASWVNVPHVTQFDEADITELEETRGKLKDQAAQQGIKLTPLAFILRACVKALQQFPQLNSSLDASGENLVFRKYMHIGFAADTPNGLLVPVVRDADHKDIYELARVAAELAEKARTGTLTLAQMQGGCFTVSSLGGIGGTAFTPIINAPEVAILGVSRAAMRPVYIDGSFAPRLMLPLSLSYDHRVVDGALAVRFTTFLARALADVRGLLEAVP
jgi:pyruvate dehydrogenase E2 component (dihydrolipoamide acetyltransferase)